MHIFGRSNVLKTMVIFLCHIFIITTCRNSLNEYKLPIRDLDLNFEIKKKLIGSASPCNKLFETYNTRIN